MPVKQSGSSRPKVARASGEARTKRVTSVDVAAESGYSQATVARVFSSPHLVAPATREKVEAAAKRLGYVPNAIARSLKSQRTNIIGAVVPTVGEYWQHALTSFSRQLTASGQQLLLFSFTDASDVARALDSVRQYRLDGVILASARISKARLSQVADTDVPVLAFNQPAASGIVPSVSIDNSAGAAALADHLVDQGCRSVLFVGGIEDVSTDQTRYRGAARALGARGVGCAYLEAGSFAYEEGYQAANRIVEGGELPDGIPDGIMVSGDELAFGVLDGLRAAGLDAPRDVMLTGFDGLPQTGWRSYDLTTLVQDMDELVARSIELLLGAKPAAAADGEPVADVIVPGTLRLGNTTRLNNTQADNQARK